MLPSGGKTQRLHLLLQQSSLDRLLLPHMELQICGFIRIKVV